MCSRIRKKERKKGKERKKDKNKNKNVRNISLFEEKKYWGNKERKKDKKYRNIPPAHVMPTHKCGVYGSSLTFHIFSPRTEQRKQLK